MNYMTYHLSVSQKLQYGIVFLLFCMMVGKLFYDSFLSGLLGIILFPLYIRKVQGGLAKKRRQQLTIEFKDFILSFSNSLKAGYSLENGFLQGYKDMLFLYEKESMMLKECEWILMQLKNNLSLEDLILDFANRSGCIEIKDFAVVFATAKRTGGNLNKIIRSTVQIISDKIDVQEEIRLVLASKKMEQNIMNIVPLGILFYIRITSPGYFDSLYHNVVGISIMSICLVLYLVAYFIAEKIMTIEV